MKYRILKPNEIEAYNIGYQVGSRQTVIADIEWESPEEKKLYRQGYNAGCQDRRRHNVKTGYIESNVSNVSNVQSGKSVIVNNIANANAIVSEDIDIPSIRNTRVSPTEQEVLDYAKQQDDMAGIGGFAVSQEQAQAFYDYYSGIGWHLPNDAQTPILDWKPFLRKWVMNPKYKNESQKDPNDEAYEADLRFFARRKREREEEARNGGRK